jgi:hypothetical protein
MLGVFCPELLGHRGLSPQRQNSIHSFQVSKLPAASYKQQAASFKRQAASIKLQALEFLINSLERQATSFEPQAASGELLDAGAFIKFFIFVQGTGN